MKRIRTVICIFFIILFSAVSVWAEETESSDVAGLVNHIDAPVRIKTVQKGSFQGILREVNEEWVEIISKDGQILFVDTPSIESYIVLDQTRDGAVEKDTFFQDSASNRLIVMPTAFPMEFGEFHVADQEIVAVTVSYGLDEHFSLWSGISIPGFLMNARYTNSFTPSFAASFGSFAGLSWFSIDEEYHVGGIIPYGIASWGEPNNNFTLGAAPLIGFYTHGDPWFNLEGAYCVIGGKKVLTSTTSLIFENWIGWGRRSEWNPMDPIPIDEDPSSDVYDEQWSMIPSSFFPAICFRIAGERLSWDIGAVIPLKITNEDEIESDEDDAENRTHYWENTGFRIGGLFDDVIIPLPIISITYRID